MVLGEFCCDAVLLLHSVCHRGEAALHDSIMALIVSPKRGGGVVLVTVTKYKYLQLKGRDLFCLIL